MPLDYPSSDLYTALRAEYLPPPRRLREPADFYDPIPISEKLVQALWADQMFNTMHLQTRDGRPLHILRPGRWNGEGGPDFQTSKIILNGQRLQGDVEIHVHTRGWHDHRHRDNPAYNNVILDVCLWDDGFDQPLRTQNGHLVPQLILHPHLEASLNELIESIEPQDYPFERSRIGTPISPLAKLSPSELEHYILSAGLFRLEQKTAFLEKAVEFHGDNPAAYIALAEALGYKHNKQTFRQIAMQIPLDSFRGPATIDSKIELLLHAAASQSIRFHPIRPANHPHRRLATLALLIMDHPHPANWFHETSLCPAKLKQTPCLQHPFWSWHYHHEGKRLGKPLALLGAGRWREIVVNVILPFLHAQAPSPELRNTWLKWPAAPMNRTVRQMAADLGICSPKITGLQQGLIQMHQDFDLLLPEVLPDLAEVP